MAPSLVDLHDAAPPRSAARARSGRPPRPRPARPRHQRGRARRQVPGRHAPASSPGSGSTRAQPTPAPTSAAVDHDRHPARPRSPSPARRGQRLAGGDLRSPVAVTANTTYVASYFTPDAGTPSNSGYFARAGDDPRPADRAAQRHRRRQRRLPLRLDRQRLPEPAPSRSENYWVDVVFDTRVDRHHAADGRPAASRRRARPACRPRRPAAGDLQRVGHRRPPSRWCCAARRPVVAGTHAYDAGTRTATFDAERRPRLLDVVHRGGQRRPGRGRQHHGAGRRGPSRPCRAPAARRRRRAGRADRGRHQHRQPVVVLPLARSCAPRASTSSPTSTGLDAHAATLAPYDVVVLGRRGAHRRPRSTRPHRPGSTAAAT